MWTCPPPPQGTRPRGSQELGRVPRHGVRRCAAGSGVQWGGPWGPQGGPRREGDVRRLKVGKTEPAGGRAGWRPGPGVGSWAARAEARAERRAEARGARLGRCGGEGGGRRGARAVCVCARSAAPGGRWPRRESWGDACCPRTLARGHGGEPDRAAATRAGGRAVWATPPSPRPPPHCRWPREAPSLGGPGGAGGRALGSPAEGWAAPPASMSHRAA